MVYEFDLITDISGSVWMYRKSWTSWLDWIGLVSENGPVSNAGLDLTEPGARWMIDVAKICRQALQIQKGRRRQWFVWPTSRLRPLLCAAFYCFLLLCRLRRRPKPG